MANPFGTTLGMESVTSSQTTERPSSHRQTPVGYVFSKKHPSQVFDVTFIMSKFHDLWSRSVLVTGKVRTPKNIAVKLYCDILR